MTSSEQRAFFEAQIKNEELDGWKAETYAAALKEAGCAIERIEVFAKQSADHKRIAAALKKQLEALPQATSGLAGLCGADCSLSKAT